MVKTKSKLRSNFPNVTKSRKMTQLVYRQFDQVSVTHERERERERESVCVCVKEREREKHKLQKHREK